MSTATAPPARKLVSASELTGPLGIKQERTILDLAKRGLIPSHRIGKQFRFDLDEVLAGTAGPAADLPADADDETPAPTAGPVGEDTWLAATLAKFTADDLHRAGEIFRAIADAATAKAVSA